MASPEIVYQKLPGTGYRRLVPGWAMVILFFVIGIFVLLLRGKRTRLWLGPDHLLLVEWDGYREYYKRLYYRDIQAIVVRRTPEWFVVSILLGVVLVFLGLLTVAAAGGPVLAVPLVLAVFFGLILAAHLAGGPSCVCQLRTAVQTVDLIALQRIRHAQKALALLRPRVEQAQSEVRVGSLATRPSQAE